MSGKGTAMARAIIAGLFLGAVSFLGPAFEARATQEDPNEGWLPPNFKWDKPIEVVVKLEDNNFDPDKSVFDIGKAYKLVLRNVGKVSHDLVENTFFHSVVTKYVILPTGTVRTPHVHSVSVQPGMEAVIHFAAVRPGEFAIFCSIPGHREDGMEGHFVIK
ncbi:MAG: multicopper oxidase domain-containing protein [Alphaproteobacteria bacterium]